MTMTNPAPFKPGMAMIVCHYADVEQPFLPTTQGVVETRRHETDGWRLEGMRSGVDHWFLLTNLQTNVVTRSPLFHSFERYKSLLNQILVNPV